MRRTRLKADSGRVIWYNGEASKEAAKMTDEQAIKLFEEFNERGYISCPECGEHIEIDCDVCPCGWVNCIMAAGMV